MSGWEWIVFIMVVVSIVALAGFVGWATFDMISEQAGDRREFPARYVGYDAADFTWTSVGQGFMVEWNVDDLVLTDGTPLGALKVHSRPALYDWEAEGDL